MQEVFRKVEAELNAAFLERQDVIRGLLVALLAREHVLLLGPPGTAKSALARELCQRIGGQYFERVLSRTSTPEELFGPVSLQALERDEYRRITTGKLPEAHVAFIDEIFKCNSAVLNMLLPVLNERVFHNNGAPQAVPLVLAVGASNELPEDRDELGALWDRFLLRYVVGYIRDPRHFEDMITGAIDNAGRTYIDQTTLHRAQEQVQEVAIGPVVHRFLELRDKLAQSGIQVSDRRWRQLVRIVQAHAWLEGRRVAGDADLAILTAALWQEPEQIPQVRQLVLAVSAPHDAEAQDLLDQALEIYRNAMSADDDKAAAVGAEANAKLKRIARRLAELRDQALKSGSSTARIDEASAKVADWNREVVNKCLGITL